MDVLEIKNLYREETGLYYRRNFTGLAVIELPIKTIEVPLDFIIEVGPLGNRDFDIELKEKIDYPLLPVMKKLKEYIELLDKEGKLP
ncbi:MAG: hypothetical protein IKK38_10190 [Spirochaetaceae bacterium]|nr:hypothetical protein [Spirochaetaceae bacterium]MBR3814225.1 hypothetical protein [Spirochaetaceae bacterium]MDD6486503.1 hypothetical protein [Spirochaetales bacterium]